MQFLTKEEKKLIEDALYPAIKHAVVQQLDVKNVMVESIKAEIDPKKDMIRIYDHEKEIVVPIFLPDGRNVSLQVDTIGLKAFLKQ